MPILTKRPNGGNILVVHVSGTFTLEDYDGLVPKFGLLIRKHGTISVLFHLADFDGWSIGAFREDTEFALRHTNDVERIAIIGENKWQLGMATLGIAITNAEVKYFEHSITSEPKAHAWLLKTNFFI